MPRTPHRTGENRDNFTPATVLAVRRSLPGTSISTLRSPVGDFKERTR
jgi:hypothetical protein